MQGFKTKAMIFLLSGSLFFMTGCSKLSQSNVDYGETKTESAYTYEADDDVKDLETINVYNDLDAFISLNNDEATQLADLDSNSEMSTEEKTQSRNAVITNYVVNLYKLASSRLSADLETVYTHTDDYLSYIALLQTFVDEMTDESSEFDSKMASGDTSIQDMDSFKAMTNVENLYMDLYNYVQTGKVTDNTKSKDVTKNNKETKKLSESLGEDIRTSGSSSSKKSSSKSSGKKANRKSSFSSSKSGSKSKKSSSKSSDDDED